jgi:sigma-B regulation protein RsbU (phosphoserine phosphatase)
VCSTRGTATSPSATPGTTLPACFGATGRVEPVAQTGGTVLGLFENAAYEAGHLVLGTGDGLFAYTDGVTEACNSAGDDFTPARLFLRLSQCGRLDLDAIIRTVGEELAAFVGEEPQADDITMLALRYLAPAGG